MQRLLFGLSLYYQNGLGQHQIVDKSRHNSILNPSASADNRGRGAANSYTKTSEASAVSARIPSTPSMSFFGACYTNTSNSVIALEVPKSKPSSSGSVVASHSVRDSQSSISVTDFAERMNVCTDDNLLALPQT
jgi:hypothetical protein